MTRQIDESVRHASSIVAQRYIELIEGREVSMEEFAEAIKGLEPSGEEGDGNRVVSTYSRDDKTVGQSIFSDGQMTYVLVDESVRKPTGAHGRASGEPQVGDLITYDRIHLYGAGKESEGALFVLDNPEVLELVMPAVMKDLGLTGDIWCSDGGGEMEKLDLRPGAADRLTEQGEEEPVADPEAGQKSPVAGDDKKVAEYEFRFLSMTYPDYFQGAGTSGTEWDDVAVGSGDTPYDAGEEALEMAAQSEWDVQNLKNDMPSEPSSWDETLAGASDGYEAEHGRKPETPDELEDWVRDQGDSMYCYVGLYLKEGEPGE